MRFELTVALKYLIPRWRQLSVSIISLISILVISLVVWLVVLFLSVTDGIEKKWVEQLVALNAPIRIAPTDAYYRSYYYLIDQLSLESNYTPKTIGEKLAASKTDPYDPTFDAELPLSFPLPDQRSDGSLKDPVKEVWEVISSLKQTGVRPQEYEVSFGNLCLTLLREGESDHEMQQTFLTQLSYIASHDGHNKRLKQMILPFSSEDYNNFILSFSQNEKEAETKPSLFLQEDQDGFTKIPSDPTFGEGILIAKHFRKSGVRLGDRGYLAYLTSAASSTQEQRIPVYVAGFYDPGMMPVGNKLTFADPTVVQLLRNNVSISDTMLGNGINIWLDDIAQAKQIKNHLTSALEAQGIGSYWQVESFHDYDFAKPVLQQLQSDKNLFTLIALIILIVACSNIISMLILLVNDKKKEIGILQSMGASQIRIATIFGICGFVMGLLSCIIGTFAAILTLNHLQSLVDFLSFLQGHEAFQAAFYGNKLPDEVSFTSLSFVIVATMVISLLAGIIPAIKAARIRPSEILRAE